MSGFPQSPAQGPDSYCQYPFTPSSHHRLAYPSSASSGVVRLSPPRTPPSHPYSTVASEGLTESASSASVRVVSWSTTPRAPPPRQAWVSPGFPQQEYFTCSTPMAASVASPQASALSPLQVASLRWLFNPAQVRFSEVPEERLVSPLPDRQQHMGMEYRPPRRLPVPSSGNHGHKAKAAVAQGCCANVSPDSLALNPGASGIFARRAKGGPPTSVTVGC